MDDAEKIDIQQKKPSKRVKSSESLNPSHHRPTPSSPPTVEPSQTSPSMDAIESVRAMYERIDPVELIDPLVRFLETQLRKMNTTSGA